MNSRFIANAAKSANMKPPERKMKTQKKPDVSKLQKREGKLLREKLLRVSSYALLTFCQHNFNLYTYLHVILV